MGYTQQDIDDLVKTFDITEQEAHDIYRGKFTTPLLKRLATEPETLDLMAKKIDIVSGVINTASAIQRAVAYMPRSKGSKRQLKTNYTPPKKKRK